MAGFEERKNLMKKQIRNLEKEYLVIALLVIGFLLIIFPAKFSIAFPWVLGVVLMLRGLSVIILALHYKDPEHTPGRAIVYITLGLTVMILGSRAVGIIGVIWAVLSLMETAEEIDEIWKEGHYSIICVISCIISVALAILLMTDPFKHFAAHVRILGLEILASVVARRAAIIRGKNGRS